MDACTSQSNMPCQIHAIEESSYCLTLFLLGNFQKIISETLSVSNCLDPDQDRGSVGPDLSANCLQRLSADDKLPLARKELSLILFEPRHEISNNVVCATSKTSDQPAHMCSLIRAFSSCLNTL